MSDIKRISGTKYIGQVPKVLYIAPMQKYGPNLVICTGCGNTVYCTNPDTAICPVCATNQIEDETP